jgi:DNA-binding LytR/AlgR family response regulator
MKNLLSEKTTSIIRFLPPAESGTGKTASVPIKNKNDVHFFKAGTAIYKVELDKINYILAYGNLSKLYTGTHVLVVSEPLKEIEAVLDGDEFVRIHRSCIVPIRKIEKVVSHLVHICNEKLPVGRQYRQNFYKKLMQF